MYSNMVSFIAYIELKCTMVAIKGDNWQCENCRCNKYCLPTSHKILLSGAWKTWWRGTVQSNTPMLYRDALLPSRQRKSSRYVMTGQPLQIQHDNGITTIIQRWGCSASDKQLVLLLINYPPYWPRMIWNFFLPWVTVIAMRKSLDACTLFHHADRWSQT